MKPKVDMKRCFASKDVCMAIKCCPTDAISYIEVDEPILDKTLNCNCNEREALGLTSMSAEGYSDGCGCFGGAKAIMEMRCIAVVAHLTAELLLTMTNVLNVVCVQKSVVEQPLIWLNLYKSSTLI